MPSGFSASAHFCFAGEEEGEKEYVCVCVSLSLCFTFGDANGHYAPRRPAAVHYPVLGALSEGRAGPGCFKTPKRLQDRATLLVLAQHRAGSLSWEFVGVSPASAGIFSCDAAWSEPANPSGKPAWTGAARFVLASSFPSPQGCFISLRKPNLGGGT